MSGELGNLKQPTRLRPPRQLPYQRDTCLSRWFVCGFLSAKVFNLAKPPSLTNCHVRKEEHRTRVTVNMKGGERQEWRVAAWFGALLSLPLAAVVSVSESSLAILQRLNINLLTCGCVTPLTSPICLLSSVPMFEKLPMKKQTSERYLQSFLLLTCRFPGKLDFSWGCWGRI